MTIERIHRNMRRLAIGIALASAVGVSMPSRRAWADSEMHQSPLLDRGSPDACGAVAQGRVLRGGYPWQSDCSDAPQSRAPKARRGNR